MKFSAIFILFNIIILFFLGFIFIAPAVILGGEASRSFWGGIWPLTLLLFLTIAGMDAFYLRNRRLLLLLEKEDWPALSQYLEQRIFRRGRYSFSLVRLLAHTYLILSDSASVITLENRVAIARPGMVEKNALIFGVARILQKDYEGAALFFAEHCGEGKNGPDRYRLEFFCAFSLFLSGKYEGAAERFKALALSSHDALVTALAACFLEKHLSVALGRKYEPGAAAGGRSRALKALPSRTVWDKERSKVQTEIHGVILRPYLEEAGVWLYGRPSEKFRV
ncbi:MAG: hypothetical protein LBG76_04395 [Treponema sp.]|nr:hypothetical protein [Treponema sp.]